MNRGCVVIGVFLFCVSVPISLRAEEQTPVIQELIQRVSDPSVPVESSTLEDIAVAAYQVLLMVPFIGVQDSQAEIEGLIMLKETLIAHSGILEQLLALRMQEAIDCTLLNEVNRRTISFREETVTPPYQEESLPDKMLLALLDKNVIKEAEHTHYLLELDGTFARFCQRENFNSDDILSGKAMKVLPSDLQKQFWEILSHFRALHEKMDESTMRDFLFAYTLFLIDQARDVRTLCEVFLKDPGFSLSMIDTRKIDKVLALYPRRRRVSTGEKNRGRWVFPVGSHCVGTRLHHHPKLLTDLFDPYFSDVEAIAAQHEGIFFWYNESGARDLSEFKTGMWLELKK